jgi:hypothetical protein
MQLGHQAANCKTGTIPWRIVFGDEAFIVRKPVFWTDVIAKREAKKVNEEQLRMVAQKYAEEQCKAKGLDYEEVKKVAEESQSIEAGPILAKRKRELEEEEEKAKRAADPRADIPEGWNVAFVRSRLSCTRQGRSTWWLLAYASTEAPGSWVLSAVALRSMPAIPAADAACLAWHATLCISVTHP